MSNNYGNYGGGGGGNYPPQGGSNQGGYDQPRLTVLMMGSSFFKLSKNGSNVAVFPSTGKLYRAGFTWPDNTERLLRGTAFLIEEPIGDGHLVLFANDPMFRGWWRALDRLVLNAVVLGPAM